MIIKRLDLRVLAGMVLVMAGAVRAQQAAERIEHDRVQGTLTRSQALYYQALRLTDPDRLPEAYRPVDELPVKDGTGIAFQVRSLRSEFGTGELEDLDIFYSRPDLPYSYAGPSGLFRIHYATEGINAVPLWDFNLSGVPDYVEETANAFEYSYSVEVGSLGLNPPPDDRNEDGPEWDVYVQNIPGAYGWTTPEKLISRNPDTYTSYIIMDNDYTHTPTKGVAGMRVTAAHELFHLIQLGYAGRDDDNNGTFDDLFLMEAGATWMEDVVYDHVNDYYYYLPAFFRQNNVPFDRVDGRREYGLCLWFHFMEKRFGTNEVGRIVWEEMVDAPAVEALDRVFSATGSSFDSELSQFYGWNLMTGARSDSVRFYPEGEAYPSVTADGEYSLNDTTLTVRVKPTAARYYRFNREDGISFFLVPSYTSRSGDGGEGECTLVLGRGPSHALYTNLLEDWQARQIAEDYINWKTVALVSGEGMSQYYQFNASRSGVTEDNLPASFPSPFDLTRHSMVTIPFVLEEVSVIKLLIVSSAGYRVLEDEMQFDRGLQFYSWNGTDENGDPVASGVYLYILLKDDGLLRREKIAVVR